MNNNDTEGDYVCKGRCAKSDRAELTHICPSKLSKRELEDLYFVLFESNLELKRTVNSQRDKIKVLTTKVLRMTAGQKGVRGENPSIRIVEEQKDSIADLKRANAQLEERVKQLNMRLCSAKQFLKRCPAQSTSRTGCNKSFNIPRSAVSVKNPTTCALNVDSADNLRISSATSCQFPNRDLSTTDAQTETMNRDNQDGSVCNDNQCRTRIEELKQKILNLQEELMKTHEEYAVRISSLEREVSALQSENMRVVAAHALGERRRQRAGERAGALAARLRDTEAQYSDVSLELTLEKKKVAELETRIKAAQLSSEVLKTLEDHLDTIQIDHVNKQDNEEQETDSKPAEKKDDKNIPLEQTPVETPISSHEGNETKSKPDQPYTSKNVDKTPASSPHRLKKNIEKPSEKESKNLSKKDNHNSYQIPGPVPANTTKRESRKQPIKKTDVKKPVTERHNTVVEGRKSRASSFSKPNEEPNQNIKKLNSQRTDIVSERKTVEKGVQTDDPSSLEYTQIPKTGTSDTVDWSRSNTCTRLRMPEPPDIGKKLKSLDICSTEEKYVQTENTNEQENTGTSCVPVAVLMLAEEEPPAGAACGRCICCQFHTVAAETTSFQHSNLDKERNENEMKTNQAQSKRVISSCQQDSEPFESCQPEYSGMQQSKINPQNQGMNQRIQFTQTQENQLAQHEIQPTENAQKQAYRNWSQPQYGRMGQEINQGQLNQQFRESPAPKSTSAQTYTLQGSAQQQKGGSPEDTDKEISSYSDLPSERDGRITRQRVQEYSRRSPMSPGEDREFTYTDTDPTSTEQPHSLTLSEGEVLAEGRAKPVSLGEQPTRDVPKSEMSARAGSPQHMQATLAAIGEELARCRRLLQRQRWPEVTAHALTSSTTLESLTLL